MTDEICIAKSTVSLSFSLWPYESIWHGWLFFHLASRTPCSHHISVMEKNNLKDPEVHLEWLHGRSLTLVNWTLYLRGDRPLAPVVLQWLKGQWGWRDGGGEKGELFWVESLGACNLGQVCCNSSASVFVSVKCRCKYLLRCLIVKNKWICLRESLGS